MRIHRVLIIPGAGHTGVNGEYTRGHTIDATSEYDVVNQYLRKMIYTFEEYGIRHKVLETRKPPGIATDKRHESIRPNDLVLSLSVGWFDKVRIRNCSEVFYGDKRVVCLAESISDVLSEWGNCSSYGHRSGLPKQRDFPLLQNPQAMSLHLEPFAINGPDYMEYLYRLQDLGSDIGFVIAQWLGKRGEAQAVGMNTYRYVKRKKIG